MIVFDPILCALWPVDKVKERAGDLRILSLLEVHKVLQDMETQSEGPTQAQYGISKRHNLPRASDLNN